MFGIIKKVFIILLVSTVNASNHTICLSLNNQKCEIQLTLINLIPNEYSQELHYYPFAVKLDKCVGGCDTLNDLSNKVCVPNKTEDLKMLVFNMITGKNESKILTNGKSCKCKCTFDEKNVTQTNGGITINVDVRVKTAVYVKKIIFGILLHVVPKMENI